MPIKVMEPNPNWSTAVHRLYSA